ncbi:hypothetical protein LTR78_002334 [Recurvomyces mirabilis]|uniref:Uncharacterized protein n=1 Tax=Recurvomyces mirabilis TaxID=574656 RepID=A0AAE0WTC3_9PEZI|nr:hypothetical protein LTR78_002334 [Recurvomyces mirabilis]KAK5157262.1 hypothetical protein LTS14_004027 [Recurvomyces mirabilis]
MADRLHSLTLGMRGMPNANNNRSSKSRAYDSVRSPVSPLSPAYPVQTSYEDLRRPEARKLLREQLEGTFPEVGRRASEDTVRSSSKMQLMDKFTRRTSNMDIAVNASAKSSSSTVDSLAPTTTLASSTGPSAELDIARAIQLLQELKKTASPDDLVALHRALLPTKEVEVVSSPQQASFEESKPTSTAPTYHRRSALPPGLATRGGLSADILRKPEDATPRNRASDRPTGWLKHSMSMGAQTVAPPAPVHIPSPSVSSLAALDLADDVTNPVGSRAVTPGDYPWSPSGGYRPGTLHITNGAASPEPSIKAGRSADHTVAGQHRLEDGYFPSLRADSRASFVVSPMPGSETLSRRISDDSISIRDRIMSSDRAVQQRKQRASRLSGISTPSKESLRSSKAASLRITPNMGRQSFDDGSVSPVSDAPTPRFKQRWSHRASHIPAEPTSDNEPSSNNTHEQNVLRDFAMRLSTVYDSDGDDGVNEVNGTPEAALSRLTGDAKSTTSVSTVIDRSSEETLPSPRLQTQGPRPMPAHKDSGYGSGDSWRVSSTKLYYERRESHTGVAPSASSQMVVSNYAAFLGNAFDDEQATSPMEIKSVKTLIPQKIKDTTDVESLYTFKEFLTSPARNAAVTKPKKMLPAPLLRLHTLKTDKRSSLPTLPSPTKLDSTDSVPTIASLQISPAGHVLPSTVAKQQKKLQKAIPPHIKKQRREEAQKLKACQASAPELPALPDSVLSGFADRFSHLPSDADLHLAAEDHHLENTGRVVQATAPQEMAATDSTEIGAFERGRGRSKSVHNTVMRSASPDTGRGWSLMKLRSKSAGRHRNQNMKNPGFDMVTKKDDLHELAASSPGDETPPAFSDFSSVAQTLGSGSYDIATNQVKRRTAPARGATLHQLQTPSLITTGLHKIKATKGMDSTAASELARMKSKDFAKGDTVPIQDRPRMATPKSGKSSTPTTPTRRVEDRFPDWTSKASSQSPSLERSPISAKKDYAESIPPMPELPADMVFKASKSDDLVAKRLKDSTVSSPDASARNSNETRDRAEMQRLAEVELIGHGKAEMGPQVIHDIPAGLSRAERAAAKQAAINFHVRELAGSSSENSSFVEPAHEATIVEPVAEVTTPSHDSQHAGWPGWEEQAKLWRKRRESLNQRLGMPAGDEISVITAESPPVSRKTSAATTALQREPSKGPSIVVSRYITPLAAETVARANARKRPTDMASQHSDLYRELIQTEDKENRPTKEDVPRTDSAITTASTSTFVTLKSWDPRPVKPDVPRTGTAGTMKSYTSTTTTTTINRARSPGGRVRTPSGNYFPYVPPQQNYNSTPNITSPTSPAMSSIQASRAAAFARINEAANSMPSLISTKKTSSTNVPTAASQSTLTLNSNRSSEKVVDRYSGGLQYGWDRGEGFSGSAGTRDSGSDFAGKRRSKQMGEQWGLDLSDVPVFLQKRVV